MMPGLFVLAHVVHGRGGARKSWEVSSDGWLVGMRSVSGNKG